ncbi:Asparagine synthase [Mesonia phycicola]|uniref:asparagine synthase (glutamine-hydrolyzing) n=1 Tax=Mesonia phycicola TaxID=579105 RepID=A0A1M6AM70_9FLAO|nr:asparagine synthase-related protein [Mesonia phycicola]SHI37604.1 Asparagine synthase [Mesonia phycicola]
MKNISTPIIPVDLNLVNNSDKTAIDYKAICLFAATGFFWGADTYWTNKKVLFPGSNHQVDEANQLIDSKAYFKWHYTPKKNYSFEEALEDFTTLFETIVEEQIGDQQAILPISGGLDSRTQAVALKHLNKKVTAYSYSFTGGYSESGIAEKIAKACEFDFKKFLIPKSYLWQNVEELAEINQCYSEFTHPRQMAVLEEFQKMKGVFSLGHWGDVLFDKGAPAEYTEKEIITLVKKKVIKKGGLALGEALWEDWQIEGNFQEYLDAKIKELLAKIDIEHIPSKMRAFKSLFWAPRWTSVNLSVFKKAHPITLPYYDNRMCEFICQVPEEYLADRKLQIAYIQKRNPEVAKITWQDERPFNLNNYHLNKMPYNLPFKIGRKLKGGMQKLSNKKYIQRNWELQFLGEENEKQLEKYLFDQQFCNFLPQKTVQKFYHKFKNEDDVFYSHPVSILLTLSIWNKKFNHDQ